MNKGMAWGMIIVALVVGVFVGYSVKKQIDDAKTMTHPAEATTGGSNASMKKQEDIMMMATQDQSSLKGTISDVSGGSGTGKAFVLRKNGKLDFTVSANLPDPTPGSFYEGWLVKKGSNPVQLVDTGTLTKQTDGTYEVSYESATTYDSYNFVVITLEQGKVNPVNPGKHLLEGTVQ